VTIRRGIKRVSGSSELGSCDEDETYTRTKEKHDRKTAFVLTAYRHFKSNLTGELTHNTVGHSLKINSKPILRALRDIVQYYPAVSLEGDCITLDEPYQLFFHNQRQIRAYLKRNGVDEETHRHFDLLLKYMRDDTGGLSEEIESFYSDTGEQIIFFSNCWLLYPPGSVVCFSKDGELQWRESERSIALRLGSL